MDRLSVPQSPVGTVGCASTPNYLAMTRSVMAQFVEPWPLVAALGGPWARKIGRTTGVEKCNFALALGPRYLPTMRLTTMAAMPASTALAIGDDRMSVIGLDADACC